MKFLPFKDRATVRLRAPLRDRLNRYGNRNKSKTRNRVLIELLTLGLKGGVR